MARSKDGAQKAKKAGKAGRSTTPRAKKPKRAAAPSEPTPGPSIAPPPEPAPATRTPRKAAAPRKAKVKRPAPAVAEAPPPESAEDDLGLPVLPPPPSPIRESALVDVTPAEESVAREFLDEIPQDEDDMWAEVPAHSEVQEGASEEPWDGTDTVTASAPPASPHSSTLTLGRQVVEQAIQSSMLSQFWGAAYGMFRAIKTGLGAAGSRQVDNYGKDAELVQALSPVATFLYERYWRVSVKGADLVPAGPSLLVANHSGALPFDGPVLALALGRQRPELAEARWLVEDQIFNAPFLGTIFNRLGAVRASPENAMRLLSEDRPVIVFPEGAQGAGKPFSQRYQLKRLGRGGFAKLAVRARVPLVPVAVVGAEEALPMLGKLPLRALGLPDVPITPGPLPARWYVRFGDPISTAGFDPGIADDSAELQRLVDRTRGEIEGMLHALLDERRSVFGG